MSADQSQKFTPGPWHTCRDGACKCNMVSCDDYPIATVTRGEWGDRYPAIRLVGTSSLDMKAEAYMEQSTYGEVSDETATANARLIAAAPDMLEALKGFRDLYRTDGHQQPCHCPMCIAERAIAKAEGITESASTHDVSTATKG